MIILTDEHFIARGVLRRSYRHPHDQELCVKVSDATPLAIKRQAREIAYYKALKKSNVDFRHIAEYKGIVDTNHGPGYLFERIHDESGETAKSLLQILPNRHDLHGKLFAELQRLGRYILENRVLFHDFLDGNILCSVSNTSKGEEQVSMKIIDGLGDTVLIPVLNYVKPLAESKVLRRWNRYLIQPLCRRYEWLDRDQLAIR